MTQIFHPLLALIASATNNELAKYVEYLKRENKTLRARIPGQIHSRPEERERLLKYGKAIGRAILPIAPTTGDPVPLKQVKGRGRPNLQANNSRLGDPGWTALPMTISALSKLRLNCRGAE